MSLKVALDTVGNALDQVRATSTDALGEVSHRVSGALVEVKHTAEQVGETVSQTVDGVVDVLPTLPSIPVSAPEVPVAKRGEGIFRLNMLQEGRRRDDPTYDPAGPRMSKAQERLILRSIFYLLSFATIAFLILAFVFQLGLGQASQAAIWALSATFLGGALALNTRVPRKRPSRCAGIAGVVITVSTFVAFVCFCIGSSNKDLDKVGMGLGVFVTLFGTIAAGLWTYNLWFPSKRAHQIVEEEANELGAFKQAMVAAEEGTLAQVEKGTPENIQNLHIACNVLTIILWYLFAVLIIFFTFDIKGLVEDANKFLPPPGDIVPVVNMSIPHDDPPPFNHNTSSPTSFPTLSPSVPATSTPTVPGETRSPSVSPTFRPTLSPITSEPSVTPSAVPTSSSPTTSPTSSMPTSSPTSSAPTSHPSQTPTTSEPTNSPTTSMPTSSPTSSTPTTTPSEAPSTSRPSLRPSTAPTDAPSPAPSTSLPTATPSKAPSTSEPTTSPTSSTPTVSPTVSSPTLSPTSSSPTLSPVPGMTFNPSTSPTSSTPTSTPTTSKPTSSPTSSQPTASPSKSPSVSTPTNSPTTSIPSKSPTSSKPTSSPTVSQPTKSPTSTPSGAPSKAPTKRPTSQLPTRSPTTSIPTRSPTTKSPTSNAPTSQSPTSKSPTSSPTSSPTQMPTHEFVPVPDPPPTLPNGTVLIGGNMHFICEGNSSARPVVLLEHDVGSTLDIWAWVQDRVANSTYVCSYSRRGYGYSNPGSTPRTPQISVVELRTALQQLNITSPIVHVGHGWGGFQLRRFYHAYPDMVAAMVFVDAYSTQCFKHPACDAKTKKSDDDKMGVLESLIPTGIPRALAYAGTSYPGPAGQCVPRLPEFWGGRHHPAKSRLLAALLSPALWTTALLEDGDMPSSCALAAQAPGNDPNNRIAIPVVSIVADDGIFEDDKQCGIEIKNAGGGAWHGGKRQSTSYSVEIDGANHFTLLCDQKFGYQVGDEIIKVVELVRAESKTYSVMKSAGPISWPAAKSLCESTGAKIATIRTDANLEDVNDAIDAADVKDDLWIGASDADSLGTFKWANDGTTVTYSNWASNEPSGASGLDCAELARSNRKWRARSCAYTNYAICEVNDY